MDHLFFIVEHAVYSFVISKSKLIGNYHETDAISAKHCVLGYVWEDRVGWLVMEWSDKNSLTYCLRVSSLMEWDGNPNHSTPSKTSHFHTLQLGCL